MKPIKIALLLIAFHAWSAVAQTPSSANSPGTDSPPPVRVRWIVDLKKTLGYQDFSRPVSSSEAWKSQQGIAFLTPDELAIYQVTENVSLTDQRSVAHSYSLHTVILDARDGHEIKTLQVPSGLETAKLMPTRGGGFLVRARDVVSLYSSKFEQVASRKLPPGKDTAFDEWQVDVSPSGAQVMLVHRQVWNDEKGEEKDARADVEVLDSETFKTVKSFSVPWLEEWSAGDNLIITEDPSDQESGMFGILDLDGKWRRFKTSAESRNSDCPYRLEALEHKLFAAHDCDDLVVVSISGAERFSQPVRGEDVLVSVAGADRYLAEALVEPQHSRAYISVYDLRKKTHISWVSLEKKSIYYSISPSGSVAAIDGEKLKFFDPVLPSAASASDRQQRWETELVDKYGYESFDRDTSARWERQQDVRFITPDEIAVYQVRQSDENNVTTESGPAGRDAGFYLQVKIFSVRDGHEMKTLRLPTTAQFTKLIPTHDGKFLLRTGDVVTLYSPNFEPISSRALPLEKIEGVEGWQMDVSPSGTRLVLVHQERFAAKSVLMGQPAISRQDHADIEVLDADTVQPINKFTVKSLHDNWSAADDFLVAAGFEPDTNAFGLLSFDGNWKRLTTYWDMPGSLCRSQLQALPGKQVAVIGCYLFGVLSNSGGSVIFVKLDALEVASASSGAGNFVAVEVDKMIPGKKISEAKPARIDVYNLETKAKVISVPLAADNPYFDVSSQGDLAVIQSDSLTFYSTRAN
ncbi:MAG TPA: hypothetical protein VJA94_13605 [Candidatus Angelobacter sp.]